MKNNASITKLKPGSGIYTVKDMSAILGVPENKIRYWINEYWDKKLGEQFGSGYSWKLNNSKAVDFHTLIELYVMGQFRDAGVQPREVLKAHKKLSDLYQTRYPFAHKKVLSTCKTDGKKIFWQQSDVILSLDGSDQFNLSFIELFFEKLDFYDSDLVSRFWPLGKDKQIIVDPKKKFGHPVIGQSNIYPETIYQLIKAGETKAFIAELYELSIKEVEDSVEYCDAA